MADNKGRHRVGTAPARAVTVCPLLLTAVMVFLLTTDVTRGFAIRISRENSVIEFVTAALLLAGGAYGLWLAWRLKKRSEPRWVCGFLALFSVGMLLVGMEEIAWGQKLVSYQTPAALQNLNQQREMTLHNLPVLHGHSDMMWSAFALGGLIGITLRKRSALAKIAPDPVLATWFAMVLCIGLTMTYRDMTGAEGRLFTLAHRMDEFTEMLIAMACCLYLWLCARRLAHGQTPIQ